MDLCKKDPRYNPDAYFFVVEALDSTVKEIRKKQPEHERHVTGKELLEGIRVFALDEFGPLAFTVFAEWGIHSTLDFGEIVFNLVECGRLGKTEKDSREDFKEVFDFEETFVKPFEPQEEKPAAKASAARRRKKR
ncbi:MAG: hypothetical protein PHU80_02620 [Kiritimatiellae bacterium]|nr:hypothetical protein [Kiritimatiellia bacterium]